MLRAGDGDGMGERLAPEIGVDQRHHGAQLHQSEPGRDVVGAVLHQKRHDVAAADAMDTRPIGVAVGRAIEIAIGERPVLVENRGILRLVPREPFHDVGDGDGRVGLHMTHTEERAPDRADIGRLARDRIPQSHRRIGLAPFLPAAE